MDLGGLPATVSYLEQIFACYRASKYYDLDCPAYRFKYAWYITVRYAKVRYTRIRYITVRYGTVRCITYGTERYATVFNATVRYRTV